MASRVVNRPITLGTALPTRIANAQQGSVNPAYGARVVPKPLVPTPGPAFAREHTTDRQINRAQENARVAGQQSRTNPLANGNLLEGLSLSTGTTTISHGLGKPIRGMLMGAMSAAVTWSFAKGATPTQNFQLTVSGPVTIDLWVYA
jgi:hypothetical protein